MKVLVTMGFFDDSGECRLVEVDLDRGRHETRLSFIPPEPFRLPEKGFTGAMWSGAAASSTLFVCGSNAVFLVEPNGFDVVDVWHQPCMNDLHHVAVTRERVYVVNTGLEAIDVFSREGLFLGSHALHPGWISAQRQGGSSPSRHDWPALRNAHWPPTLDQVRHDEPRGDYYTPQISAASMPFSRRKLRDYVHPNHVAVLESQILVTRFLDRAVEDIVEFTPVIEALPGLPHDGFVHDDQFWLTCVNGLIVAHSIERGRVTAREVARIDAFASGHAGWCRGLFVTRDHLVVGLTEIRRMPQYRWADRPIESTETSILLLHKRTGKLEQRVPLNEGKRHTKIFSVLPM